MKIAIIRLSALGDTIQTAIALQFIKKNVPNAQITWFCDEKFSEILSALKTPARVISLPLKSKKFLRSWRILREFRGELDLILDFQGLVKSAIVARILGANSVGFDENGVRERLASKLYARKIPCDYGKNVILRYLTLAAGALGFEFGEGEILSREKCFVAPEFDLNLALNSGSFLSEFGHENGENSKIQRESSTHKSQKTPPNSAKNFRRSISDSTAASANSSDFVNKNSPANSSQGKFKREPNSELNSALNLALNSCEKAVLIAPFSSDESKNYAHFDAVARELKSQGNAVFVCFGDDKELERAQKLAQSSGAAILPKFSASQMVAVVEKFALVIGNDSAIIHLAWAQNRPCIALFGNRPSERNFYATPINVALDAGKKIDARRIDKSDFCINEIEPKRVIDAANRLLNE